jgi:hypothetical protein
VNGEWNIVVGATILHGTLDCVTFLPDGRSARVSGIVESVKFSNIFQAGTAFAMLVVDTGEGSAAPPDRTSDLLTFANQPPEVGRAYCEDGVEPAPVEPEDTLIGDFQVRADLETSRGRRRERLFLPDRRGDHGPDPLQSLPGRGDRGRSGGVRVTRR